MLYKISKVICLVFLKLARRLKVFGDSRLPPGRGIIVVANHISYWDPLVIGCSLSRKIFFMAKAELFNIAILGSFINNLGAFPVQREGTDRSSIRRALELLGAGKVVGIFPEGTRSKTGETLNPHLGAAMLALKGGVPLLPVAVSGTKGYWGRVKVNIGKPMYFNTQNQRKVSRTEMEHVSRDLMAEINRLLTVIDR